MITLARMLMYGKEASNRKQEIDRQHHTIPYKRVNDMSHIFLNVIEKTQNECYNLKSIYMNMGNAVKHQKIPLMSLY